LSSELQETRHGINGLIWAIWASDFRDLSPDLERIATLSSTEKEGDDGNMIGPVREVEQRYHLARHIVSIWNETDLLTQAKLLVALSYTYSFDSSYQPERMNRFKLELSKIRESFSQKQKDTLISFVLYCEKQYSDQGVPEGDTKAIRLRKVIESIILQK
jgi:hypothetical protein